MLLSFPRDGHEAQIPDIDGFKGEKFVTFDLTRLAHAIPGQMYQGEKSYLYLEQGSAQMSSDPARVQILQEIIVDMEREITCWEKKSSQVLHRLNSSGQLIYPNSP